MLQYILVAQRLFLPLSSHMRGGALNFGVFLSKEAPDGSLSLFPIGMRISEMSLVQSFKFRLADSSDFGSLLKTTNDRKSSFNFKSHIIIDVMQVILLGTLQPKTQRHTNFGCICLFCRN